MIRRCLIAAGTAAVGLLTLIPAAGVPAAAGIPPRAAAETANALLPATLSLSSVHPVAPQPGDTVRLGGTLTLTDSAVPVTDLTLQLWVDPSHVTSRSEFDNFASTSTDEAFAGLSQESQATVSLRHSTLHPDQTERWQIEVPIGALGISQWGVYEMGVVAVTADGATEARLRTFLPFAPLGTPGEAPLRVSWLWPLVDQPHRNIVGDQQVFADDALAPELNKGGRLQELLQAASTAATPPPPPRSRHGRGHGKKSRPPPLRLPHHAVPVTYAIDPMLVQDAQQMAAAAGYVVRPSTAVAAKAGTGKSSATTWLSSLTNAVHSGSGGVIVLPYGDPDIAAAVHDDQTSTIQQAYAEGQSIVSRIVPSTTELNWAWPPDGMISSAALDELFTEQISGVVLDGSAFPPTIEPATDPNAHVSLPTRDGPLSGLLADPELSDTVTEGASADSGLELQRYLAETLMIQSETPGQQRSIVVTPARRWDPSLGYATHLLTDTGRVPWIQPSTLPAAAAAPIDTTITRQLNYPRREQRRELPTGYVDSLTRVAGDINQLAAILNNGAPLVRQADETVLQGLSSAWRGHIDDAEDYESELSGSITHTIDQVHIASGSGNPITLTSSSGTFPITIANNLDQPVRVRLRIGTNGHAAITGQNTVQEIPPRTQIAVDLRAKVYTSGQFPITARLVTPGPGSQPYGRQVVTLYMRSTAYGIVALLISGGALVVLLVAVAVRLTRRALRARRSPAVAG